VAAACRGTPAGGGAGGWTGQNGVQFATGSKPWYHEFHWHGLQLLAGNSFVLAGPRERLVAQVLQTTGIRDKRELPRRRS
jgi:hypothetical protein